VNGIGPFSLFGSRLDSGACCQPDVQERRPRLLLSDVGRGKYGRGDSLKLLHLFVRKCCGAGRNRKAQITHDMDALE